MSKALRFRNGYMLLIKTKGLNLSVYLNTTDYFTVSLPFKIELRCNFYRLPFQHPSRRPLSEIECITRAGGQSANNSRSP